MTRPEFQAKPPRFSLLELHPNEKLSQHFLIDPEVLTAMAQEVIPGASIIEIGSGSGNITTQIAPRAGKIYAIEIDPRLETTLAQTCQPYRNVEVVIADVQKLDLQSDFIDHHPEDQWQVFSNLPFHVSEPLIRKLAELSIENAILILGVKLV